MAVEPGGARIRVSILSATGLRDADRFLGQGKSDPYCILRLAGRAEPVTTTRVIDDTCDPVWDHRPAELEDFDLESALEFEVRDRDPGGRSDLLGRLRVEAEHLLPYGFEGELPLAEGGRGFRPTLRFKVEVLRIPKALRKEARVAQDLYHREAAYAEGATVELTIVGAAGLRNADRFTILGGKSDPYCICRVPLERREVARTCVLDDTLEPEWNHGPVVVERVPMEGPALAFEVWDKDVGKTGDLLGQATLTAERLLPTGFDGWLPLERGGRGHSPKLHLTVKVLKLPAKIEEVPEKGLRGLCIACCGPPPASSDTLTFDAGSGVHDEHGIVGLFARAHGVVLDAAGAIDQVVEEAIVTAEDAAQDIRGCWEDVAKRLEVMQRFSSKFAGVIELWMKARIREQLETILDSLPAMIKGALNRDPDMIQRVWRCECRMVDAAWPDIRQELMKDLEVMLALRPRNSRLPSQVAKAPHLRRYLRYVLFPYDKSFWGKAKSPLWWLLVLGMVCPLSVVSALVFLVIFFVIDKSDEYQIMQFILQAKASQFLGQAVCLTFGAYVWYLDCVVAGSDELAHRCRQRGPAGGGAAWWVLGGWLLQLFLPWLALCCLPCTRPHEDAIEEGSDSDSSSDCEAGERGLRHYGARAKAMRLHLYDADKRHIRRIMAYDLLCLVLVLTVLGVAVGTYQSVDHFIVRQILLGCKVGYGYLALPFFLFALPISEKVLLHCQRTGYDEDGRCRFYQGAVRAPRSQPKPFYAAIQEADADAMLGQLLGVFRPEGRVDEDLHHELEQRQLFAPSTCASCSGHLRGLGRHAFVCKVCSYTVCHTCKPVVKEICIRKQAMKVRQDTMDSLAEERARRGGQSPEDADADVTAAKAVELEVIEAVERRLSKQGSLERLSTLHEWWQVTSNMVKVLRDDADNDASSRFADLVRVWIKRQCHDCLKNLVNGIPDILKWSLEERDMPPLVKRAKDRTVDLVWREIHEEIMLEMELFLDGQTLKSEALDQRNAGVDCLRRRLRYAFMPYDKSIWWQLKDPVFWLLTGLPLIPIGVNVPAVFLLIFLFIDKSDEYQLINFILLFKGTQFISLGLVRNIIGFYLYVVCTSRPHHATGSTHSCAVAGPGASTAWNPFWLQVAGLITQILLTWLCFARLPWSKEQRGELAGDLAQACTLGTLATATPGSQPKVASQESGASVWHLRPQSAQGGKLRWLVFYDFLCVLVSGGVLVWVLSLEGWSATWVVEQTLFSLQILYGYMALPFFVFNLPGIKTVFTHSVPTGYDAKGRIRKHCGPGRKDEEVMRRQLQELEELQRGREKRRERQRAKKATPPERGLLEELHGLFQDTWGIGGGGAAASAAPPPAVSQKREL